MRRPERGRQSAHRLLPGLLRHAGREPRKPTDLLVVPTHSQNFTGRRGGGETDFFTGRRGAREDLWVSELGLRSRAPRQSSSSCRDAARSEPPKKLPAFPPPCCIPSYLNPKNSVAVLWRSLALLAAWRLIRIRTALR